MQNRIKRADRDGCYPIGSGAESGQIALLRGCANKVSVSCCPIEVSEVEESEENSDYATTQSKQADKTVRPLTYIVDVTEMKIQQQCSTELPANGMFGLTEEVANLKGLFVLSEEGLDSPATLIVVTNAGGRS